MSNLLIHGDCIAEMKKLKSQSIDAIITDIPYFGVLNDDCDNQWKNTEEYLDFIHCCIKEFDRILKDNSTIMMFTGRQYNRHIALLLDKYFEEKRIIIWSRKRAFNNTRGKALASGYEPICYYVKGKPIFNNIKIKPNSNRKEYVSGTLKDGVSLSDVWSDIPALGSGEVYFIFHVAKTAVESGEPLIATMMIGDELIEHTIVLAGE